MKLNIEASTGNKVSAIPGGSCGFFSWVRLVEVIGAARELREGEIITHFAVDEKGVSFRTETSQMGEAQVTGDEADADWQEGLVEWGIENASGLCEGCPPIGYPTDKTRCASCPRRAKRERR